jgi:hypothetical protein
MSEIPGPGLLTPSHTRIREVRSAALSPRLLTTGPARISEIPGPRLLAPGQIRIGVIFGLAGRLTLSGPDGPRAGVIPAVRPDVGRISCGLSPAESGGLAPRRLLGLRLVPVG